LQALYAADTTTAQAALYNISVEKKSF